ncbi:GyrI-like domain-containing protein [Clostridium sp. 'deep sea']|uniref:GyrI-like domain-containing protein n=1 Tax=Clostridium sp. 'deep sea' TaxID=2779445 RepID=UPI00189671EF|nr:GyrI-like domain-containing protein [Clostridium sp. 'deep sea']QOR35032.1 GyrI-like domain-containing protein [Clostridium sp. 'deep sea']
MKYELITLTEMQIVGLAVKADNSEEEAFVIGNTWQRFFDESIMNSINNKITSLGIGLYANYESDALGSYTFLCGCEVTKNKNPELNAITIPAGKYGKFTIKGHPVNDLMKAWQEIWQMQLNRKFTCDFEVYHYDNEDMNNQTIDIYIALK